MPAPRDMVIRSQTKNVRLACVTCFITGATYQVVQHILAFAINVSLYIPSKAIYSNERTTFLDI